MMPIPYNTYKHWFKSPISQTLDKLLKTAIPVIKQCCHYFTYYKDQTAILTDGIFCTLRSRTNDQKDVMYYCALTSKYKQEYCSTVILHLEFVLKGI